jgi:hypothetical protein
LRRQVGVAVVVADPEAARHAVIQLVFAVLGVRDAVRGKDAAGLGFIGGVIGVIEPGSRMRRLRARCGADAERGETCDGAGRIMEPVFRKLACQAQREGVAAAAGSSRAASSRG